MAWGARVVPGRLTKSRMTPYRKIFPPFALTAAPMMMYMMGSPSSLSSFGGSALATTCAWARARHHVSNTAT